jgi:hypothetical protein
MNSDLTNLKSKRHFTFIRWVQIKTQAWLKGKLYICNVNTNLKFVVKLDKHIDCKRNFMMKEQRGQENYVKTVAYQVL